MTGTAGALTNRRFFLIGVATLGAGYMASMRVSVATAEDANKAEFIKAAMAELDESARRAVKELAEQGIHALFVRAPHLIAFADLDFFYIDGELHWSPNDKNKSGAVTVPKGFVSDLASIPQLFWSALPKTGRHAYAAVVHDYLYWAQTVQRSEADVVLKAALEDLKVPAATIQAMYYAVSYGGQSAWDNNARLKAAGEKRVLKRFPGDGLISWSDWRREPDVFAD